MLADNVTRQLDSQRYLNMIKFRVFINEDFLLENRIEFLKTQNPTLDTSHDTLAKHTDAGGIIDHFAKNADPTTNKAHTQWIVNQYKKKSIRQEDAPQIKSTLKDFADVKDRLERKDLNQYKDLGDLRDAVATQKPQAKKAATEKKSAATRKSADLEKLYDSDGVVGFKIPNKESSIANYGPQGKLARTHWCTAANSSGNAFNNYKGGKYTMHFPNNEVLQFHHQSNQIMDKNDAQVSEGDSRFAPYEHHISKFIKQTRPHESESRITRFTQYEPHEVDNAINAYKQSLHSAENDAHFVPRSVKEHAIGVIKTSKLSDSQFDDVYNLPSAKLYGDWTGIPHHLASNRNLSHKQVGKLIDHPNLDMAADMHRGLAGNPAVKKEHITALLNSPHLHEAEVAKLASNPHLEPHHIDELMSMPDAHDGLSQNHHIKLSPEHQKTLVSEGGYDSGLAGRADLHSSTVDQLVNHGDNRTHAKLLSNEHAHLDDHHIRNIYNMSKEHSDVAHALVESPKVSDDIKEHTINDSINALRSNARNHTALERISDTKYFNKSHIDKMLDAADDLDKTNPGQGVTLRNIAAKSNKASASQIDRMVNSVDKNAVTLASRLIDNKNVKPAHLKKIFDHSSYDSTKEKILEHPSANHDVLHHVFDTGHNWDKTAVLHHPSVQTSHFHKAMDIGPVMHGAVSSSPSTPPSILDTLSHSPLSFVRQNVAAHKNTSPETISRLANDDDEEVASVAGKRSKKVK